jgi:phosphoglycerol transferase MdoB-like AlkP superfamily enzyme
MKEFRKGIKYSALVSLITLVFIWSMVIVLHLTGLNIYFNMFAGITDPIKNYTFNLVVGRSALIFVVTHWFNMLIYPVIWDENKN